MFQNFKLGFKIGAGYFLLAALLVLAVAATLVQTTRTNHLVNQLVNDDAPMTNASMTILNGLNQAVAAMRGWMLLGQERFRTERQEAWSEQIEPALQTLRKLAVVGDNKISIEQLASMEKTLQTLKKNQEDVEKLARTVDSTPALKMLLEQVEPLADQLLGELTRLIASETGRPGPAADMDGRKSLLKIMTDVRNTTATGLAAAYLYVQTRDDKHKLHHEEIWSNNKRQLAELQDRNADLTAEQRKELEACVRDREKLTALLSKMIAATASEDWNLAHAKMRAETSPASLELRQTLDNLLAELKSRQAGRRDEALLQMAFLMTTEWILLIAGVVLSAVLGLVVTRSITGPLAEMLAVSTALAEGDLTKPRLPESADEIGHVAASFNKMTGALSHLLADAKRMTAETSAASNEITTAAQEQVSSLNETATSLSQIAATAEQFKATMQEFADRARAVLEAAEETSNRSREGRHLSQDSAAKMAQVRTNAQAAGESVLRLAEQMQRIGEITAAVNEIAEQTKLLALNASIEAARAGEEGRGFAVVATHVRELANQSKEAAGRIEAVVGETQQSMRSVVAKIQEGSRLSEDSSEIVHRLTEAFEQIAEAIEQTKEAMAQINTSASQQERGIVELVSGISAIDTASRQLLTSAEQTRTSIGAIHGQIQRLDTAMARFKT